MTRARSTTLAAALLTARVAGAQPSPDEVARRDLIAQAEAAAERGDHDFAIERATRAEQLRTTPSIQYFLAREHLSADHPLDALAFASACVTGADADPTLHSRDDLLAECRALVAASSARVGRVIVRAPSPALPGTAVRVNGQPLRAALLGVAYPVAPGVVRIDAEAPGATPFARDVTVAPGASVTVDLALSPAPVATPAPPAPPVALRAPDASGGVRVGRGGEGAAVAPWVAAGVGAAGIVVAGVLYAVAAEARAARDAACDASGCDPAARALDDRYGTFLLGTDVALGVATTAMITAGVWWIVRAVAPSARRPAVSARDEPLGCAIDW